MSLRTLHVLESLSAGGMETTFLHTLRALRRIAACSGQSESHDVLSFVDGLLESPFRAEADHVFIGSEPSFLAQVLSRDYDVVHILFERCAHRLAPLIFATGRSAVVYGKGYDIASMYRMQGDFDWRAEESLLTACDAVTFTTAELARRFNIPEGRSAVLGKAFDYETFSKITAPDESTPDRILCVANLYPRKRLEDLMPALRKVRDGVPTAELRIVGGGSESERARLLRTADEEGVGDAVVLAGASMQIAAEMAGSRVLALPSDCEGVPTVLLEAMGAGRPVVATAVGDVASIVTDGREGFLVDCGDIDALADRIQALLLDRALAERMGAAGRARARPHDVREVARRLHEVLLGAATGSKPQELSGELAQAGAK